MTRRGNTSLILTNSLRYKKQVQELEDKGWFTMADGARSTEMEVAGTKRKANPSVAKSNKKRTTGAVDKSVVENGKKNVKKGTIKPANKTTGHEEMDLDSSA